MHEGIIIVGKSTFFLSFPLFELGYGDFEMVDIGVWTGISVGVFSGIFVPQNVFPL